MHFGDDGNILKLDPTSLTSCHILVAGPPCPPFSKLGSRKHFADSRAAVFWKVVEIILHQAKSGVMVAFVLENVEGFAQRAKGSAKSPLQVVLEELRSGLPRGWILEFDILNSVDFGLPQSRRRVYIVGRFDPEVSRNPLVWPKHFQTRASLKDIVNTQDVRTALGDHTPIQRENIRDWKRKFERQMTDSSFLSQYCIVDYTRTPSGRTKWGGTAVVDRCECLTAAGPALHVFSLGCGTASPLVDRPLRVPERAMLQGFPVRWGSALDSETDGKRIFGNAMSVPVLASLLGSVLTWWRDTHLSLPNYPSTSASPVPEECIIAWHSPRAVGDEGEETGPLEESAASAAGQRETMDDGTTPRPEADTSGSGEAAADSDSDVCVRPVLLRHTSEASDVPCAQRSVASADASDSDSSSSSSSSSSSPSSPSSPSSTIMNAAVRAALVVSPASPSVHDDSDDDAVTGPVFLQA